jgi:hypothetical protein
MSRRQMFCAYQVLFDENWEADTLLIEVFRILQQDSRNSLQALHTCFEEHQM